MEEKVVWLLMPPGQVPSEWKDRARKMFLVLVPGAEVAATLGEEFLRGTAERDALGLQLSGGGILDQPRSDSGTDAWESLTPSEGTVARLVAEGLTNPEIGRRLFVSPRTVETHLKHAFAKLGLTSRVDLATFVTRLEQEKQRNPGTPL